MRHNEGGHPDLVEALARCTVPQLANLADQIIRINGVPDVVLRDLLEAMAEDFEARSKLRCVDCGDPVDMTGRTYEPRCWRCFLDNKAASQRRRRDQRPPKPRPAQLSSPPSPTPREGRNGGEEHTQHTQPPQRRPQGAEGSQAESDEAEIGEVESA